YCVRSRRLSSTGLTAGFAAPQPLQLRVARGEGLVEHKVDEVDGYVGRLAVAGGARGLRDDAVRQPPDRRPLLGPDRVGGRAEVTRRLRHGCSPLSTPAERGAILRGDTRE